MYTVKSLSINVAAVSIAGRDENDQPFKVSMRALEQDVDDLLHQANQLVVKMLESDSVSKPHNSISMSFIIKSISYNEKKKTFSLTGAFMSSSAQHDLCLLSLDIRGDRERVVDKSALSEEKYAYIAAETELAGILHAVISCYEPKIFIEYKKPEVYFSLGTQEPLFQDKQLFEKLLPGHDDGIDEVTISMNGKDVTLKRPE